MVELMSDEPMEGSSSFHNDASDAGTGTGAADSAGTDAGTGTGTDAGAVYNTHKEDVLSACHHMLGSSPQHLSSDDSADDSGVDMTSDADEKGQPLQGRRGGSPAGQSYSPTVPTGTGHGFSEQGAQSGSDGDRSRGGEVGRTSSVVAVVEDDRRLRMNRDVAVVREEEREASHYSDPEAEILEEDFVEAVEDQHLVDISNNSHFNSTNNLNNNRNNDIADDVGGEGGEEMVVVAPAHVGQVDPPPPLPAAAAAVPVDDSLLQRRSPRPVVPTPPSSSSRRKARSLQSQCVRATLASLTRKVWTWSELDHDPWREAFVSAFRRQVPAHIRQMLQESVLSEWRVWDTVSLRLLLLLLAPDCCSCVRVQQVRVFFRSAFLDLLTPLSRLTDLRIQDSNWVLEEGQEEALCRAVASMPHLRLLSLRHLATDAVVAAAVRHCSQLQILDVFCSPRVTTEGVERLLARGCCGDRGDGSLQSLQSPQRRWLQYYCAQLWDWMGAVSAPHKSTGEYQLQHSQQQHPLQQQQEQQQPCYRKISRNNTDCTPESSRNNNSSKSSSRSGRNSSSCSNGSSSSSRNSSRSGCSRNRNSNSGSKNNSSSNSRNSSSSNSRNSSSGSRNSSNSSSARSNKKVSSGCMNGAETADTMDTYTSSAGNGRQQLAQQQQDHQQHHHQCQHHNHQQHHHQCEYQHELQHQHHNHQQHQHQHDDQQQRRPQNLPHERIPKCGDCSWTEGNISNAAHCTRSGGRCSISTYNSSNSGGGDSTSRDSSTSSNGSRDSNTSTSSGSRDCSTSNGTANSGYSEVPGHRCKAMLPKLLLLDLRGTAVTAQCAMQLAQVLTATEVLYLH